MRALIPLLLLVTATALAQPRAYFPWWESRLTRDIDLSQEQQDQIREIQRSYRHEMIDQRAALEKAEAALEDVFNEVEISDQAAEAAIDNVVAARSQMTRSFTEMSIKLRRVLTIDQWHELERRRSEWSNRRGREGGPPMRRPRRSPKSRGEGPEGPPPPPDGDL